MVLRGFNARAKGARSERKVRDVLIDRGYRVMKSGASLGAWDLIAFDLEVAKIMFVQVKSNRRPASKEMAVLKSEAGSVPADCDWEFWIAIVKGGDIRWEQL